MPTYRAQFTIPYFTNLPEDVIVNDWHAFWPVGTPSTSDFEDLRDDIVAFYDDAYNFGANTQGAPWVGFASTSVKMYRVDDPTPRAPHFSSQASITIDGSPSTTVLPCEVAICCSFQGTPVSGEPQARKRGRIFLGGLAGHITAGDTDEFPHVGVNNRDHLCDAMETLRGALIGHGWVWVVYSRVANESTPVEAGWVDDAPDTQRRRGQKAVLRSIWP